MTTSELSLEQMKRLAEIVTGHCTAWLDDGIFTYQKGESYNGRKQWLPSLTGEGWQREQALDVIVAAYGRYRFGCFVCNGDCRKDILHASALALLGDKT